MIRIGLLSLAILMGIGYVYYPMIGVLLAPLCNGVRPGQLIITDGNAAICPNLAGLKQLARKQMPILDLPPWILVKNGCYPAAHIPVKVAEVDGDFLGVRLTTAIDKNRVWWVMNPSVQLLSHMPDS